MQFGPSSERLAHHIDQLELGLEDLETNVAAKPTPLLDSRLPHRFSAGFDQAAVRFLNSIYPCPDLLE